MKSLRTLRWHLPCARVAHARHSRNFKPSANAREQSAKSGVLRHEEDIRAPSESFVTHEFLVQGTDEAHATVDALGETTIGNMRILQRLRKDGVVDVLGLSSLDDIVDLPVNTVRQTVTEGLREMEVSEEFPDDNPTRSVYCNRTLNLRSIQAIGFDMDYTLLQYDVQAWEGRAYHYGLQTLAADGIPTEGLQFDPTMVTRGLVMDKELGNLIKVDRFGLVKRAMHGTRMLTAAEIRREYGREIVKLSDDRWLFVNTLFAVSEGCVYMQMVDRFDQVGLPQHLQIHDYRDLHGVVAKAFIQTHVESALKSEIIAEPEKYVEMDPELATTLLDMKRAGKILMLITNSDWQYTDALMSFAYNRFLPAGMHWKGLFDMVIVQARKPEFWRQGTILAEIVDERQGLLKPVNYARRGGVYFGGSAALVEKTLGLSGDLFLYVGDHIYTDAALAKLELRWRTALIIRELEDEIDALTEGKARRRQLQSLLAKKELIGDLFNQMRVSYTRRVVAVGQDGPPDGNVAAPSSGSGDGEGAELEADLGQLLMVMDRLDDAIEPLVSADGGTFNERWGYLSIAGINDKSQLQRQIEKYADIYTSRVANFCRYTPYAYFSPRGQDLIHDRHAHGHQAPGADAAGTDRAAS